MAAHFGAMRIVNLSQIQDALLIPIIRWTAHRHLAAQTTDQVTVASGSVWTCRTNGSHVHVEVPVELGDLAGLVSMLSRAWGGAEHLDDYRAWIGEHLPELVAHRCSTRSGTP
ncbi:MAG TPA: hypothetical protein VMK12_21740 [Anaeromyxobacteraceae bacterium]|nr:hypothetical protein [Anaeromyxobacteraceae bacterium]